MSLFSELRTSLKSLLSGHLELSNSTSINSTPVAEIAKTLESGELSVAVVGEINRASCNS
jgi:hypothetical protein